MCPSLTGAKGLYHLIAADVGYPGVFHARLALKTATSDLWVYYPRSDSVGKIDSSKNAVDTYFRGDLDFAFGMAFTNWLEVSLRGRHKFDFVDCDDDPTEIGGKPREQYPRDWYYHGMENRASIGRGDTDLGIKFIPSVFYKMPFDFAVYPYISLATGIKRDTILDKTASFFTKRAPSNDGGVFRYFTNGRLVTGLSLLLSKTTKTHSPISGYLNLGYLYKGGKSNEFQYGIGTDVLFFNYFDPFIELWGATRSLFGEDPFGDRLPSYITLGLKFLGTGISADICVDFLVTGEKEYDFEDFIAPEEAERYCVATGWGVRPTWAINLGIGYSYDIYKMRPITNRGMVTGRIVDKVTKKGIDAVVSATGGKRIVSDPLTGSYDIEVEMGKARLVVSKEGYYDKTKTIEISRGERKIVDFELKPKTATSAITGRVIDKWTTKPIDNAKIELMVLAQKFDKGTLVKPTNITRVIDGEVYRLNLETGSWEKLEVSVEAVETPMDFNTLTASDEEGIYHLDPAPTGTHIVTASREDYISQSSPVVCNPDETVTFNFELLAEKIILYGIHFEFNKANIFVDSYPILDKLTQFLKESPDIRVEIGGHTDWVGTEVYNLELSTDRANAVRNYLIQHGAAPHRVIAKGYGEATPIANNSTEEGRALNRRIELKILKR